MCVVLRADRLAPAAVRPPALRAVHRPVAERQPHCDVSHVPHVDLGALLRAGRDHLLPHDPPRSRRAIGEKGRRQDEGG